MDPGPLLSMSLAEELWTLKAGYLHVLSNENGETYFVLYAFCLRPTWLIFMFSSLFMTSPTSDAVKCSYFKSAYS